jgi:hypothetical protein
MTIRCRSTVFHVLSLLLAVAGLSGPQAAAGADYGFQRPDQDLSKWERTKENLLWGFSNMYQPCVREIPGNDYRYRMWFFGWAVGIGNKGFPGCDAIFHARSKDLKHWEIYSGEGRWDATMNPKLWVPVITADNKPYDDWHNGDPSVVVKDGRFFMAFSSTGSWNKIVFHPNNMLLCVMGATSKDGIHWKKTAQPLLIEPPEAQSPTTAKGWTGDFHRPSLMWDEGKWRLWFDYWHPTKGVCMAYAENVGHFDAPGGFEVLRAGLNPLLVEWPNPEVVKVGNRYHSFADPIDPRRKYDHIKYPMRSRAICEAVSDDGLNWKIVGFIQPEDDAFATHVPQALVTEVDGKKWLYLFYSTQRGGEPTYDYRYDRIRAMRREVGP